MTLIRARVEELAKTIIEAHGPGSIGELYRDTVSVVTERVLSAICPDGVAVEDLEDKELVVVGWETTFRSAGPTATPNLQTTAAEAILEIVKIAELKAMNLGPNTFRMALEEWRAGR